MENLLNSTIQLNDLIDLKLLRAIKSTQLKEEQSASVLGLESLTEGENSSLSWVNKEQLSAIKEYVLQDLYEEVYKIIEQNTIPSNPIPQDQYKDYVALACSNGQIEIIQQIDILYCKSESKKTIFFRSNGKSVATSTGMGEFEKNLLNSQHFYRIHHSYLVNLRYVQSIIQKEGQHFCELQNGELIPISKRKMTAFRKLFKLKG